MAHTSSNGSAPVTKADRDLATDRLRRFIESVADMERVVQERRSDRQREHGSEPQPEEPRPQPSR